MLFKVSLTVLLLFGSFNFISDLYADDEFFHVPIHTDIKGKSCLSCHIGEDAKEERLLNKYSMIKAYDSYQESYHGRIRLLKDDNAPYCINCHEGNAWKDIIPASNPKSKIHKNNIAKVCAKCHGSELENSFVHEGSMHLPINERPIYSSDPKDGKASLLPGRTKRDSYYYIGNIDIFMLTYWLFFTLAFTVLGIMYIYVFFDFVKRFRTRKEYFSKLKAAPEKTVSRFGLFFRVQHFIFAFSVLIAILTGIPVKFAACEWAQWVVSTMGGNEIRHILHVTAGWTMIILGIVHWSYYLIFSKKESVLSYEIIPTLKDFNDFVQHNLYNLGLRDEMPKMGRFTWYEKLDYLGATWGVLVMGITGLCMFFMNYFLQWFNLSTLQIAWIAHSEEALLATLFLLVVHIYHAHFNPWKFPGSMSWLNGKISNVEKEEEHPLED